MLARLLRTLLLLQMLAGAALGWWWASDDADLATEAALAGAVVLPLLVMVLIETVSATLSSSGEGAIAWWRALLGEIFAGIVVFLGRQPWAGRPPGVRLATGAPARVPVLLVHGYLCNHRLWDDLVPALRAQGHAVLTLDLEPLFTSIERYAPLIDDAVARLRAQCQTEQVALVGHSMGGLAIRAWMQVHGTASVARVLTLGTPHAGTRIARLAHTPNGRQMRWRSPWLHALQSAETEHARSLLRVALTPQDNIVYPQRAQVPQAVVPTVFEGIGHVQMVLHRPVIDWVLQQLADLPLQPLHDPPTDPAPCTP